MYARAFLKKLYNKQMKIIESAVSPLFYTFHVIFSPRSLLSLPDCLFHLFSPKFLGSQPRLAP